MKVSLLSVALLLHSVDHINLEAFDVGRMRNIPSFVGNGNNCSDSQLSEFGEIPC